MVLGPSSSEGRQLVIKGPITDCRSLHVTATDTTMWSWNVISYCHRETPDQTPVAVSVTDGPESMEDVVKRMIQTEFSKWAETKERGTFEEEDDFDITDDPDDFISRYELQDLHEEEVITSEPPEPPAPQEETVEENAEPQKEAAAEES